MEGLGNDSWCDSFFRNRSVYARAREGRGGGILDNVTVDDG